MHRSVTSTLCVDKARQTKWQIPIQTDTTVKHKNCSRFFAKVHYLIHCKVQVNAFQSKRWVDFFRKRNRSWIVEECWGEQCQVWKWRNDRRSERNLCNCVKRPEKKFRTSRGFEPVTSRLPVRCSTNWPMKPLGTLRSEDGDGREMYKKAWCSCKIVVLLIKPIAFVAFPLPSPSSDLKVPTDVGSTSTTCSQRQWLHGSVGRASHR